MNKTITATADQSSEIRTLPDNEIENVTGGFIPVLGVVGLGILFVWGMIAGDCIAETYGGAGGASIPAGVGLGA